MTGKLIVNMTINGVGYYRHEVGHPVLKTTQVRETMGSPVIKMPDLSLLTSIPQLCFVADGRSENKGVNTITGASIIKILLIFPWCVYGFRH